MSNSEIWKDVVGYEGSYQVSNLGRVKRIKHTTKNYFFSERIVNQYVNMNGYMMAPLSKDGKDKHKAVHRLVAQAFIPNPNNLQCVNHKDENKQNNNVENLEWCTKKYNTNYGTMKERKSKTMLDIWAKRKAEKWAMLSKRTVYLTYMGETHTIPEWAEYFGIEADAIRNRYYAGWNIEDIFKTPPIDRKTVDITKKSNVKCLHCCNWDKETSICSLTKQKKTKLQKCNEFQWSQKVLDMYKRKLEIEKRFDKLKENKE